MAKLGNYDSGAAETPETDESVSVSIFLDEEWYCFFCIWASGDFGHVNYFLSKYLLCFYVQGIRHTTLAPLFKENQIDDKSLTKIKMINLKKIYEELGPCATRT